MPCSDCRHWITMRATDYGDSSRIINFEAPAGKGQCQILFIETGAEFSCNKFEPGTGHVELTTKPGAPWHHSNYKTCPDCDGTGVINDGSCGRCCRTGRCLFYDDGYIGEERTRRHPKEAEIGPPPPPACPRCTKTVEKDWMSCPWCGQNLAPEVEIVSMEGFVP